MMSIGFKFLTKKQPPVIVAVTHYHEYHVVPMLFVTGYNDTATCYK